MNHQRVSDTISGITLHGYILVFLSFVPFTSIAFADEEKKNTSRAVAMQPIYIDCVANAGKDTALCTGASTMIGGNPSAIEGTPPYTFAWFPAAGLDYVDRPNPIATPSVTTDYILTITDVNNIQARDTVRITVSPLTAPVITAIRPASFCEGDSTILDAGKYKTCKWSTGDTSRLLVIKKAGNYSVSVVNDNNCSATSEQITVTVYPKLIPPIIKPLKPTSFYEGDFTILDAGNDYKSYKWSNGSAGATLKVTEEGEYSVSVTNGNGCEATSAPVKVTFKPVDMSIDGPAHVQYGTMNSYSVRTEPPSTYSWSCSGNCNIMGGGSGMRVTTSSVSVTIISGCQLFIFRTVKATGKSYSNSLYVSATKPVVVEDFTFDVVINVYPNPTDDELQIEVPFSGVECRASTVLGMTIVKKELQLGKTSISLSDFPSGIYCVELTSGSRRFVRMITKQ